MRTLVEVHSWLSTDYSYCLLDYLLHLICLFGLQSVYYILEVGTFVYYRSTKRKTEEQKTGQAWNELWSSERGVSHNWERLVCSQFLDLITLWH